MSAGEHPHIENRKRTKLRHLLRELEPLAPRFGRPLPQRGAFRMVSMPCRLPTESLTGGSRHHARGKVQAIALTHCCCAVGRGSPSTQVLHGNHKVEGDACFAARYGFPSTRRGVREPATLSTGTWHAGPRGRYGDRNAAKPSTSMGRKPRDSQCTPGHDCPLQGGLSQIQRDFSVEVEGLDGRHGCRVLEPPAFPQPPAKTVTSPGCTSSQTGR